MKTALRTQQIIADETLVTNTIDPLGGSWYVESLTDRMEADINGYLEKVEEMGGTLRAIELSFFQREIADFAYDIAKRKASGELPVIGVNRYVDEGEDHKVEVHKIDPETEKRKIGMLQEVKAARDEDAAQAALAALTEVARDHDANLMPATIDAVKAQRHDGRDRQRARGRLRALRRDAGVLSRIERFSAAARERAGLAGALVMHPVSVYYLAGTGQPAQPARRAGRGAGAASRAATSTWRRRSSRVADVREGAGFSAIDLP